MRRFRAVAVLRNQIGKSGFGVAYVLGLRCWGGGRMNDSLFSSFFAVRFLYGGRWGVGCLSRMNKEFVYGEGLEYVYTCVPCVGI